MKPPCPTVCRENAALLLSNYEDADTTAALRPYEARIFEVC